MNYIIQQSTTPNISTLKSRAGLGRESTWCFETGGIMAMRAQSRTVIDPMYIEDAEVMNVSKIIMGGLE